jgi:hypothetical protein
MSYSSDDLFVRVVDRFEDFLRALMGPPHKVESVHWRWGSKGALSVAIAGEKRGTFMDWSDELNPAASGGVLHLVMWVRKCDKTAAVEYIRNYLNDSASVPRTELPASNKRRKDKPPEDQIADARARWNHRHILARSEAVRAYLRRERGIVEDELPEHVRRVLRDTNRIGCLLKLHHFKTGKELLHGIIIPLHNMLDGTITAVHVTYLHRDGRKLDGESEYPNRRTYGVAYRPDLDILTNGFCLGGTKTHCAVTEGFENGLSAAVALPPRWTVYPALNRGRIEKWTPPPECHEILILPDPDTRKKGRSPGMDAAYRLRRNLIGARGISPTIIAPPVIDEDYNQLHRRIGTAPLRAFLEERLRSLG